MRLCTEYEIPVPKKITRTFKKTHVTDPPDILEISVLEDISSDYAFEEAQHVFGHYICDFHMISAKNADIVADAIQYMLTTINNKVVFSPPSNNGEG